MKEAREVADQINEDILEVIKNYVTLKQSGNRHWACCPFHNEDSPSFAVTPAKGIYKCYGCGVGGDSINFIMRHENVEFKEAVEIGAKKLSIDFNWRDTQGFNSDEYDYQDSLKILNDKAATFFEEQFKLSEKAQKYYTNYRGFEIEEHDLFRIGYAPERGKLTEWAKKENINKNLLIDAGLVKVNEDGSEYESFSDRLMFPICNKGGKILGFTGRTLKETSEKKVAKYLNTGETKIFTKGNELFAINIARSAIGKEDRAYLVEGNTDVKRMHVIGVSNTVAPCGTALTENQVKLLKKYTNKVTMVYDGDISGQKAVHRNAEILIKQQMLVSVIILPDKEDPDSAFRTREMFEAYNDKQTDYLCYKVEQVKAKAKGPVEKSEVIKATAALVACYDEPSKQLIYIDTLSAIIGPKKAWQDEMKVLVADKPVVEQKSHVPKGVSLDEYHERGFYENKNCYYFADAKGNPVQRSNCVLTPLFHIESTVNAKRLYEIKNVHGMSKVVEVPQKDMGSLAAFRVRIESLGNFWFHGGESDLNRLKAWLYEKTQSAKEVEKMGWNKGGFFVWGNGIYNGKFTEVDHYGIVKHDDQNYYIPARSSIYKGEENLFEFERKFIHIEGTPTLREYVKKFTVVFGDNGRIALCFTFASMFRDLVIQRFDGKFPLLNMFGPKGAGKNACTESLLYFFGLRPKVPNLHNTSKPALADHVATSANAICALDEYRNDLDMEKREFLKGLWDGIGRTRMNMDKDKKKETTSVDQGVIVCGQQMATADIALFSRFMSLSFTQVEYTKEEETLYDELHELNVKGLTHLTHQILKCRKVFKEKYRDEVEKVSKLFTKILGYNVVETRILNNWLSIMASYSLLNDELDLPWDYNETIRIAVNLMLVQNAEIKKSDDLGQFWKVVQFLISSNLLFADGDYKSAYVDRATRRWMENGEWKIDTIQWPDAKTVIWLTTSRVFSLYKQQCGREGDKPLPESTIEYYLKNSKSFLFETKKESFHKIDPKTGDQEKDGEGRKKRTSTTALLFDLDMLPVSLTNTNDDDGVIKTMVFKKSVSDDEVIEEKVVKNEVQQDLPF